MIDDSPRTRRSLVIRLRDDHDREAWSSFLETYAPLVERFLRRQGFQDADALDVVQDVFMTVAANIHQFEHRPERAGSFRNWLYTIVRNRSADHWRRERRQPRGTGDTHTQQMLAEIHSDNGNAQQQWDEDYRRHLLVTAAKCVKADFRDTTWQAFWRTTVEQASPQSVAAELEISVAAVYMAKRRVFQRIQQQIAFLEGQRNDTTDDMS